MRAVAKSLLLLVVLAAVPAFAQSPPPARVGRVSLVSGTLAFYGPGDTEWSAAKVNLPVAAGGWFATDPQSRAELRIGPNSLNLANDTQLNFADLRDKVMQIALTQGRIGLHLRRPAWRKDETVEIDIPRGAVWLSQAGVYDIAAGAPDQPTRIMVFAGSARFVGGGVDMTVKTGDQLVLTGSDTLSAAIEHAAPDEFVEWCRAHDYRDDRVASARHVSPAMTGFEELDTAGQWSNAPDYGPVWYPNSLPADWAPYREGHWVWVEPWGWNWIDDEPWGFAPFHYGRWARIAERWGWVPGEFVAEPVYAPALVAFIPPAAIDVAFADRGSPIGWFPLAPGEVFWPSYTRDPTYIRSVNITNVGRARLVSVTTAIVTRPGRTDPPPQVVNQPFANRGSATVVPAQAFLNSSRVAPAAVAVPRPVLQRAAVSVAPPPAVARPAAVSPPAVPTTGRPPTAPTATAAPPPATRPNFSQLAPAPRVGQAGAQPAQSAATPGQATSAPAAQAIPPAAPPSRPPGLPSAAPAPAAQATSPAAAPGHPPGPPSAAPAPAAQATPPAAAPGRPPGPPDFSHLAPARVAPPGPAQRAQQPSPIGPTSVPPGARTALPAPQQPAPGVVPSTARAIPGPAPAGPAPPPSRAHAAPGPAPAAPTPPPSSAHAAPGPGPAASPPASRPTPPGRPQGTQAGPTPPPPNAYVPPPPRGGASAGAAPDHSPQQRASQEQAQQRAAAQAQAAAAQAQAAAAQQAQQRAAAQAQAAAAQQAQQRAAAQAQAAAAQQAQQRAAAQAQAAAAQQAQQRAAAAQQAQQRAAPPPPQQHAAPQQYAPPQPPPAHQQQARECGHPGQPPCPK